MPASNIINLTIGLAAIGVGFLMFKSLPRPEPQNRSLPKPDPELRQQSDELPFLSVIIPARNESARITPLLESLNEQNLQSFEVLVVDDDSSDNTAEVAEGLGAKVLQRKGDRQGAGKSAACWYGANQAKGEWLLFLDADTCFTNPEGLQDLLFSYKENGAKGILALQPFHTVRKLYENLSAIFNIIVIVGMNGFTAWGDRFRTAGSFGPCILTSKGDYFLSGGHKKIEGALMDDLALGEAFLDKNLPVRCLGGKGIISFRMYPEGFRSLVEGWCKSFAIGSKSTHPLVMGMTVIWIAGSFISLSALISAIASAETNAMIMSGLLYMVYAFQTGLFARRSGDFPWFIFLFHPALFLFFIGVYGYSSFRVNVLHTVIWKGRKINV
ncbi:glycosyltransferase family 2 protein [Planomicrobium sp. CPCC 101110]|uniref:glycosyltransferase family 2 protein n=1 Tax=Planomicrobium sp. CPCC 101110 TaxID=2599619 RepID=UPI0011B77F6D|nr:glycosyltransferase family 2 protein [Planomicrobium sp. CPCC 101110]TWT26037.1 glycosyltransferase family 2 protein [Planomicrobium sp. CPCC 101110]